MVNNIQKKVLILALFAGEIMMKSGAEIYRVEDTIVRICKACKIDYVECFATTTGIFLSLDNAGDENDMYTFIKRIKRTELNLNRISAVNAFSRVFTTTDLSVDDGFEQLKAINASKEYPLWVQLLGAIIVGAFFCPMFDGSVSDMFIAGGISGVSFLISTAIQKLGFPDFIRIFISCAGAAAMVLVTAVLGAGDSVTPIIIAATVLFLPGMAITNAARDFLSGDMLSGVARLTEALIAAIAIAGGISIGIKGWQMLGGAIAVDRIATFAPPWFIMFGFFATFGFCFIFNAPKKLIISVSLIGAAGTFLLVFMTSHYGIVSGSFAGACVIAILAEIASRAGKEAATVFIIPGIIPFVPGSLLYKTMDYILEGDYTKAAEQGTEVMLIAGSIAVALVLVATLTRLAVMGMNKLSKPEDD